MKRNSKKSEKKIKNQNIGKLLVFIILISIAILTTGAIKKIIIFQIAGFALAYFSTLFYFIKSDKKNYRKSFRLILNARHYFFAVAALFIISIAIGIFFQSETINDVIKQKLSELINETKDLVFFGMLWFIFKNNSTVAFLSIIFGVFFSLIPLTMLFFNGYVIGFVIDRSLQATSIWNLWKFFPHGIFELPAVLISMALGIKFGLFLFTRKPKEKLMDYFTECMRVFVFVIVPLLAVAAVIETGLIFAIK